MCMVGIKVGMAVDSQMQIWRRAKAAVDQMLMGTLIG